MDMMKSWSASLTDRFLSRRGQRRLYVGRDSWSVAKAASAFAYRSALQHILEHSKIDCVIDVGANDGQFAQLIRACGFCGPIISFEPVPATAASLRKTASADPCWEVFELAMGNFVGTAPIYTYPSSDWNSLIPRSAADRAAFQAELALEASVSINVTTLDTFSQGNATLRNAKRCYLKIDTEGFDAQVVEGAPSVIARSVAAIQMELSGEPEDETNAGGNGGVAKLTFTKTLQQFGFGLVALLPSAHYPGIPVVRAFDCIAVKLPSNHRGLA